MSSRSGSISARSWKSNEPSPQLGCALMHGPSRCPLCERTIEPEWTCEVCPRCMFEATRLRDPKVIGGFEIEGRLGHGGMGIVYRARQKMPDRVVALKIMRSALADDVEPRFRNEIDAA